MSRLFIENNGLTHNGTQSNVPSIGAPGGTPGYLWLQTSIGRVLVNIGTASTPATAEMYYTDGFINRYSLIDRQEQIPVASTAWNLNATFSDTEAEALVKANVNLILVETGSGSRAFSDGGGVTYTTGATSANNNIITPNTVSGASSWGNAKWNTLDEIHFEAVIKTPATITSLIIWAGYKLTNTATVATDDDQAFFRVATDTSGVGNWTTNYSIGGTDTSTDLGSSSYALAASTSYHLLIKVDTQRVPHFYINGVLVKVGTALTTNIDLIPFVGIQTSASAAKSFTVRGVAVGKTYND